MPDATRRSLQYLAPALLVLGACTVQPPVPPPPPLPERSTGADSSLSVDSWRFLASPKLDSLVLNAWRVHPSAGAATATLAQAEALLAARRGATEWPQIDAGLTGQRQRFNPSVLGQDAPAREFSLVTASVAARYSVDLFGGNRHVVSALRHRVDVRRFEVEGLRSALAAAVATAALNSAWQREMLDGWARVESLERARVQLAHEQLRLGAATREAVDALERSLEAAHIATLRQTKVVAESDHLLQTVAGRGPGIAPVPTFAIDDFAPVLIDADSVPTSLLLSRPDIRAADAVMRATHADYGATVARAYPQLQLSASSASQALAGGGLFGPASAIYSLVSQLSQPLLQRGQPAERRAAQAGFDAAFAQYESVVLESWRTVSDLLAARHFRDGEVAALSRADSLSHAALQRTHRQVALGAASRWQLLTVEQQAEQARLALRFAQLQRLADRVAWYRAIPGAYAAGF